MLFDSSHRVDEVAEIQVAEGPWGRGLLDVSRYRPAFGGAFPEVQRKMVGQAAS